MSNSPAADGGGRQRPPVTSDVVVDPGEIRQFAKFLDDMTREVDTQITKKVQDFTPEGTQKVDWGRYEGSERAAEKHRTSVQEAYDKITRVQARSTEVVDATQVLAGQYDDLEELNGATAAAVRQELEKKRGA